MRIIFFMLYFLSVSYTENSSSSWDSVADQEKPKENTRDRNTCEQKEDNLELKHNNTPVPLNCSCKSKGNNETLVEQCFNTYICKEKCKDYISDNANFCDNIPNNRNNENALCQRSCNEDPPNFMTPSSAVSQAVNNCDQKNRRKLQDQLVENCRSRINNIERSPPHTGATLVCPGRAGCERYCQSKAQEQINGMRSNCEVKTKGGFRLCEYNLNNRLRHVLLQNSGQLPQVFTGLKANNLAFSFQERPFT